MDRPRLSRSLAFGIAFLFAPAVVPGQDVRNRLGVYVWGQLSEAADPLVTAAEDVRSLGTNVVRVTLAPYWDPRGDPEDRFAPLDRKLNRPDYQEIFRRFPVVMITAYDARSYSARYRRPTVCGAPEEHLLLFNRPRYPWIEPGECDGLPDSRWRTMLEDVREEFRQFAFGLSKLETTFVISNWEAENDASDDVWNSYLEYIQARMDGVQLGREQARQLGYPAKVFSAFEFTHVHDGWRDPWLLGRIRLHAGFPAALKLRNLDYLAYSAWESIFHTEDRLYTARRLKEAFADIRSGCREINHPCRLIVGEAGYLRDHDPDNWNLNTILSMALDAGASYVINWSAYDQPGQVDSYGFDADQSLFGKFDLQRRLTSQGLFFKNFLRSPLFALPEAHPASEANAGARKSKAQADPPRATLAISPNLVLDQPTHRAMTFEVSGGRGDYIWLAPGASDFAPWSNKLLVSYHWEGEYFVIVYSADGQSAKAVVTVRDR